MMIIVALIAILVQLAVPNYQDRLLKTQRLGAKTTLMQAQMSLEDCYLLNMTYEGCALSPANDDYKLQLHASAHDYTLQLQAKTQAAASKDTLCSRWQVNEKNLWRVFAQDGSDQSEVCLL
jgi:Tfp pilus assembly protein PilE